MGKIYSRDSQSCEGVVKFTAAGGHDFQQEEAKKVLELGKEYEVISVDVGGFVSTVYLKGHKQGFNTCLFEKVSGDIPDVFL